MPRRKKPQPGKGQLMLERDQRLADIRRMKQELAKIPTPDVSWDAPSKLKESEE